ncbi:hypothetical protein LTR94_028823 [Friedmanniomyces endolithicus]|nr:hypothetical protein LTR94_028823 [Friedmanniomyces endolithicus]
MGAKGAVEIIFRKEAGDPAALAAREAEYKDRFANPFVAAGLGYIDDVIMPHGTRRRLVKALRTLKGKAMKHVLFICSRNRLRSPTAEQVFAGWPNVEVASAGLAPDAEEVLTGEMVEEADIIFVMEKQHRAKLAKRFRPQLSRAKVVCLDIPDDYAFMQPELVSLLKTKVSPFL